MPSNDELRKRRIEDNESIKTPDVIGKLPDGRLVKRFVYRNPENLREHTQYIYVIDKEATISVNSTIQYGKTESPTTSVIIGGVEYTPKEKDK